MPLARVDLVGDESRLFVLSARTRWVIWPELANIHRNLQGGWIASLEAHLDEASRIGLSGKDRGLCLGSVGQRGAPKSTNVCQLQKGVHAIPSTRWREELDDPEEDFDGNVGDGARSFGRLWNVMSVTLGFGERYPRRTPRLIGLPLSNCVVGVQRG